MASDEQRRWRLILARVPSLALMLTHLEAHCGGAYWDTRTGNSTLQQQLRPEDRPQPADFRAELGALLARWDALEPIPPREEPA